jgi:phospholipid/cholesterol/gamma-HCH transport system substrate-binding protein
MTSYRKNLMVGVVVLGAIVTLCWMILKFGEKPATFFSPPQINLSFMSDRADGLAEGSAIAYRGVQVGRVTTVTRLPDNLRVRIEAQVDKDPPLPANVTGAIERQSFLGSGSSIALVLTTAQPEGVLASGTELPAKFVGLNMLPPEFADLAREAKIAIAKFNQSGMMDNLNEAVTSTNAAIKKATTVIEHLDTIVGDEKVRGQLREAIANINDASQKANRIATNVEKFSNDLNGMSADAKATIGETKAAVTQIRTSVANTEQQISGRLEQIAKILEDIHSVTVKIDKGQGTAGLLVNDPKLYDSLVESSRELRTTIADFNRLIEQWEQEGVYFNLSGKK